MTGDVDQLIERCRVNVSGGGAHGQTQATVPHFGRTCRIFHPLLFTPPPSFYHDRHDPHRRFLLIYAVKQVNVVSIQLPHGRDGAENGNAGRGQSVDSSAELKGVMMNINDGGK